VDATQDPKPGPLPVRERLRLYFELLKQLPLTATTEEALKQAADALKEIEDRHSGLPENPNPAMNFDGRLYFPKEDNIMRAADGTVRARTRGHFIDIDVNGGINIISRTSGAVEISKPGGGEKI
jgi:hypothetical protein